MCVLCVCVCVCVRLTCALCSTEVCRMAGWEEAAEMGMVVPVWLPCETIEATLLFIITEWPLSDGASTHITWAVRVKAEQLTISVAANGLYSLMLSVTPLVAWVIEASWKKDETWFGVTMNSALDEEFRSLTPSLSFQTKGAKPHCSNALFLPANVHH